MLTAATVLASTSAGAALAADRSKPIDFTVRAEAASPVSGGQVLKWDARRGRWGVTFNLERSDARPSSLNDMQAGAYYRITPSLRVGGSVALGDQQLTSAPRKIGSEESQPRVRLETAFKF